MSYLKVDAKCLKKRPKVYRVGEKKSRIKRFCLRNEEKEVTLCEKGTFQRSQRTVGYESHNMDGIKKETTGPVKEEMV